VPLVTCPKCRAEQIAPRELVGLNWNCPGCGHEFRVGDDARRRKSKSPTSNVLLIAIAAVSGVLMLGCASVGCLAFVVPVLAGSGEARTLAADPWFTGKDSTKKLDAMLNEMTNRGNAMFFVNRDGDFAVFDQAPPHDLPPLNVYFLAEIHSPTVKALKGDRKMIVVSARTGQRLTRREALAVAQDHLRRPSRDELVASNAKVMEGLFGPDASAR
jgi:hypothetical protein